MFIALLNQIRLLKHPAKEYYQCTTIHFFENLSDIVKEGNSTELRLYGLTPDQWEDTYHTVFNSQIFFIPLVIIVSSYVKIFLILSRYMTRNAAGMLIKQKHFLFFPEGAIQFLKECPRQQSLDKSIRDQLTQLQQKEQSPLSRKVL